MVISVTDRIIDSLETKTRILPLYQIMAHALAALSNLRRPHHPMDETRSVASPWDGRWQHVLDTSVTLLPRGGGFDVYPNLCDTRTRVNRLVFMGSYHKMNDVGSYDGWIDYTVSCMPDFLQGYSITVRGGTNDFKDWCTDSFQAHLSQPYDMNEFLLKVVKTERERENAT